MTNGTSAATRLLFVIDNDYGALGLVMYLLYRQPLAARATLLLPRRAYDLHRDQLPVASRPYQSLQDILDFVAAESPDAACLFSGYLFARQGVLPIHSLRGLVRALRERGCKVATSDPYLGTFADMANANILVRTGAFHRNLERGLHKLPRVHAFVARLVELYSKRRLQRHVRRVDAILADVTRLYPVPMEGFASSAGGSLSFFNPLYFRSEGELARNRASVSALPGMDGRPRWLFVLAQFDLEFQEKAHGKQGFVDKVAAKLREARENGRHATFIGPAAVVEALAPRFAAQAGVSLLSRCSFEEFEQRLLDAEMAFYWQAFSTSGFLRLWHGLPVFFFDPGHSAHLSRPLHAASLERYYLAGAPVYLDIDAPLETAALTAQGPAFRESARRSRERLASLHGPEGLAAAIAALPGSARRA